MSSAKAVATAAAVIIGAGFVGYLVYRLSTNDGNGSLEDRINAAATAATDASQSEASASRPVFTGKRSAAEVLTGDQPAAPERPAPRRPKTVPEIYLPDLSGKKRSLTEWQGRPLMINFWATWCGPCRDEIPLLMKLRTEHAKEGLEIIGIAMDFHDPVAAYVARAGMPYPVLLADQDATAPQALGVGMGLPTTLFVDRDGRIVSSHVGELHRDKAVELLAAILPRG